MIVSIVIFVTIIPLVKGLVNLWEVYKGWGEEDEHVLLGEEVEGMEMKEREKEDKEDNKV